MRESDETNNVREVTFTIEANRDTDFRVEVGDMRLYPGGDLPGPGRTVRAWLWLHGVDLSGYPPASSMPATLPLSCTIQVGAFLPNMPVLHQGDRVPQLDWAPARVWWSRTVMPSIPNPEARR